VLKITYKLHQNLYKGNQFAKVSVTKYIQELIEEIKSSFTKEGNTVKFELDIEDTKIQLDFAINISFHQLKDTTKYRLIFKDNGKGLPADFDVDNSSSFGLQLVYGLVEQLHGEISITGQKGTCFTIIFKKVELY